MDVFPHEGPGYKLLAVRKRRGSHATDDGQTHAATILPNERVVLNILYLSEIQRGSAFTTVGAETHLGGGSMSAFVFSSVAIAQVLDSDHIVVIH